MNRKEIIKEIKEFIRSKEGIVLIGVFMIMST